MQVNQAGFENSFKQHLDAEQRRAVLEAIGARINPDSTIGEVLDAAEALGWSEQMGGFSLADLAEALLAPESDDEPELTVAEDDELEEDDEYDEDELDEDDEDDEYDEDELDEDEDEDEFELVVQESPPRRKKTASKKASSKRKTKKAASKKTSSKKASSKKASSKKKTKKAASKKTSAKKSGKRTSSKKTASKKKASRRKLSEDDVDTADRMSLDQAADFFLPHVEALGEATMQALEEETGVSRRKLRFHVGQLVKNGYLERHGMGRGTYYTLA